MHIGGQKFYYCIRKIATPSAFKQVTAHLSSQLDLLFPSSHNRSLLPFCRAPNETIALLQKLAANKKKRNAAREAEAQQRAAFLESEQRAAEQDATVTTTTILGSRRAARADATLTDISALQEQFGLGGYSTDYLDTEKILYSAEPAEPTLDVDANVAAATKEALTSLGLYNSALIAYFQDEDRIMTSEVFRNAVISGVVATQAIKKKHCTDETASALFSLLAFSSDGELAGAAFRSLLCMLGEDTIHRGTGVDAGYGFDTNQGRDSSSLSSMELSIDAVPSAAAILHALEQNGYMPAGHKGKRYLGEKQDGKDTSEELNEEEGTKDEEHVENTLRVNAILLLLQTSVAICNHCIRKPEAATKALPSSDVSNLLIAVMYMGLDAAAVRLQPDLDAACIALVGALTDDDWILQLPLLSKSISEMGKSSRSRLRVLCQLPVDDLSVRYRVRQLQRFAGCILVENILPANLNSLSSAIPSRGLIGAPDPTDILLSQPWFRNPKAVVSGATPPSSVTAKNSPPAYTTSDVEILLHLCDLLLWPSALRAVKDRYVASGALSPSPVKQYSMRMIKAPEDDEEMLDANDDDDSGTNFEKEPKLSSEFMAAWSAFLTGIVKNIRTLQPEEMAVKTLASRLEFKYKETVEKPLWALSP